MNWTGDIMGLVEEVFIYDGHEKRMIPFSKWIRVPNNENIFYKEMCHIDFEHKDGVLFHIENENINIDIRTGTLINVVPNSDRYGHFVEPSFCYEKPRKYKRHCSSRCKYFNVVFTGIYLFIETGKYELNIDTTYSSSIDLSDIQSIEILEENFYQQHNYFECKDILKKGKEMHEEKVRILEQEETERDEKITRGLLGVLRPYVMI